MQAGRGDSGAVAVGGAEWAWGFVSASGTATYPAAAPLTRVCGAAAASRQSKYTALHFAAMMGEVPCVKSLLKAGADASLKDGVSDGAEGRGGGRSGVGARGRGGGGGGGLRRRRAASPRRPAPALSPRGGRLHLHSPPSPSQDGTTALGIAKYYNHTEVIKLLENAPAIAAQVSHAAPHRPPAHTASLQRGAVRPVLRPHPCDSSPTIPYLLYVRMLFMHHRPCPGRDLVLDPIATPALASDTLSLSIYLSIYPPNPLLHRLGAGATKQALPQ